MRMVLAIGGRAVEAHRTAPARGRPGGSAGAAARLLAPLVRDHQVVITHGVGSERAFGSALAGELREAVPGLATTSLKPSSLVDVAALVDAGLTVIAAAANERAVVALATEIEADALMLLTEVDAIYRDFGTPGATPLRRLTTVQAKALLEQGAVAPPSMAPKLDAAMRFAATGGFAVIAALADVEAALHRTAGTRVVLADAPRLAPPERLPRHLDDDTGSQGSRGAGGSPPMAVSSGSRSPKSSRNGGYSSRRSPA
jgi:carbamate kinase